MTRSLTSGGLVIALAFTFACKKKNNDVIETPPGETPVTVTYDNYSQLKVGNYWIYNRVEVAQNGTETDLHQYDSCYIDKDTLIRGEKYFKINKYDFLLEYRYALYLRDSLHYTIDRYGKIGFSSQDFSTVFDTSYVIIDGSQFNPSDPILDTVCKVTRKMNDKDFVKNVPAGNFKTSNMQSTYKVFMSYAPTSINNPRYLNTRYAKNIGLVSETELFYVGVSSINERRLVRYHLE